MQKTRTMGSGTLSTRTEPQRLSKLGQWRRDNPGGIIEVIDRKAVNR